MAVDARVKAKRIRIGAASVLVVVALAGYVVYDFWVVEQKTKAILVAPGVITAAAADDPQRAEEGVEVSPPTVDDISTYTVAADAPRFIKINKLNITARVRPMGVNADKTIQSPKNVNDAGWYTGSSKPGAAGAMFIDGHASGVTRYGLFGNLDRLRPGDEVIIEKGDGTPLTYRVVHTETLPLDAIDMNKILQPYGGVEKGLNLMTCTGKWLNETKTLDHRIVVYTEQV